MRPQICAHTLCFRVYLIKVFWNFWSCRVLQLNVQCHLVNLWGGWFELFRTKGKTTVCLTASGFCARLRYIILNDWASSLKFESFKRVSRGNPSSWKWIQKILVFILESILTSCTLFHLWSRRNLLLPYLPVNCDTQQRAESCWCFIVSKFNYESINYQTERN